jgi:purine-binding chemotaxis protein CheW
MERNFFLFSLSDNKFALPLTLVKRVVHAVQVRTIPDTPPDVLGIICVAGDFIPVISIESRLNIPQKELELYDFFILISVGTRTVAIKANELHESVSLNDEDLHMPEQILNGMQKCVSGLFKIAGEIVLINPEDFFHLNDDALFSHIATVTK